MSSSPKPNLFVIGAQKSGTTSLHAYLSQHPDIFMSDLKEPAFFVPEAEWHSKEMSWYLSLFGGARDQRIVGESSTHYTMRPLYEGVPDRIHSFQPDSRLVYVMRDPIERAISHYWQSVKILLEHRPIIEAIREESTYRQFGDYEYQLLPYVERFGRERLHVLTFERLVESPRDAVNDLAGWLGLDPLPGAVAFRQKNSRPTEMEALRARGLPERFRETALWSGLSPFAPRFIKEWGKRLARRRVTPTDEFNDQVIDMLRPWAVDAVERLSDLLGREFPEWQTSLGTGLEETRPGG